MTVIDDYKSSKNKELLVNASSRMIKDKFSISINDANLAKIVLNIIAIISNDVILINKNMKLNEINNLTLVKVKEYVEKQVNQDAKSQISETVPQEQSNNIKSEEADYLMDKVQELEEKRRLSNTLLSEYLNLNDKTVPEQNDGQNLVPPQIPIIIDNVYKTIEKKNKKTFIINSYSRDWVKNPSRNSLQFKIGIDLLQNVIEPLRIMFPFFVKSLTPYVVMILTDGNKTQKYNFIMTKDNGSWDEWTCNGNEHINMQYQNWNISFYDYLNKELELGNDDIPVSEVTSVTYDESEYFKLNLVSNHEHNLNLLEEKKDYIMLKAFDGTIHNVKVYNKIDSEIIIKKMEFKQEDFINSKILNTRAQYTIFFQYYTKD
jgi:hypothetical protein